MPADYAQYPITRRLVPVAVLSLGLALHRPVLPLSASGWDAEGNVGMGPTLLNLNFRARTDRGGGSSIRRLVIHGPHRMRQPQRLLRGLLRLIGRAGGGHRFEENWSPPDFFSRRSQRTNPGAGTDSMRIVPPVRRKRLSCVRSAGYEQRDTSPRMTGWLAGAGHFPDCVKPPFSSSGDLFHESANP